VAEEKKGIETATAVEASELAAYQPGAVVSRTVIDRAAGTVTVFAFDAGEGLSEHTAPFDALVHVIDGKARVTIGGSELEVAAGRMVVMPAGVPHSLRAVERFKMILTMIRERPPVRQEQID
jgi:quercetin dioxygenase-like cupin family protein